MIEVYRANSAQEIDAVGKLFAEYASSIGVSICFENLDSEIAGLPGPYAPPHGRLLIAADEQRIAGCVGLKRIDDEVCEMKRLFVRKDFRGRGVGLKLTTKVLEEASNAGYTTLRLDTLPTMTEAIALYEKLGFQRIAPFRDIPVPDTLFMHIRFRRDCQPAGKYVHLREEKKQ
ncbi:MAG TPA: GNAT family N-acetyltransferase [Bacteroidota bacterium]|nr:GNAT family N-acetyltransferase [Bacteroidota bacterium]